MKRSLLACLLAGLSLAACGGGAGSSGSALPASGQPPAGGTMVPASATTNPDGTLQSVGSITALFSGGFTLNTGSVHGLIHVYTNASTVITGGSPFVNEQVQVIGTGSWSTSITATSVANVQTSAVASPAATATPLVPIPTPSPALITRQGPILLLGTGKFEINAVSHGYMWIYYNSATQFFGGTAPVVGKYVQVSGGSSSTGAFTATTATLWASAPSSTTAAGTIVAGTSYGFTMNVQNTIVPVIIDSGTVLAGGVLSAGSQASVTGTGATSESITAVQAVITNPTPVPQPNVTPTPTPGPISQVHVITGDYLGKPDGNGWVTPAQAAPYVNWAQTVVSNANNLSSAGIKVQMYTDPNRTTTTDSMYTSDETTFAHDCNGNRVTDLYNNSVTQYVMDPNSTDMQTLFRNDVTKRIGTAHVDALFVDDSGPLSGFTSEPMSATPCNYSDNSWLTGGIALNNAAPVPVIFNGLSGLNGHNPSLSIGLLNGSNTIGGNYEHCYSETGNPEQSGWLWTAVENTELQVNATGKLFECMSINTTAAETSQTARTYAYASFLLTYNPATSIFWEMFATTSGLHVLPESGLVPLDPVVSTPSDISGLLLNGGAYGREYQHCYLAGAFVSACAVVVNPSSSATAINPYPQYTHTLVMNGSDVLDGGSVATNGPAAPMYLPAQSAAIVFP